MVGKEEVVNKLFLVARLVFCVGIGTGIGAGVAIACNNYPYPKRIMMIPAGIVVGSIAGVLAPIVTPYFIVKKVLSNIKFPKKSIFTITSDQSSDDEQPTDDDITTVQ